MSQISENLSYCCHASDKAYYQQQFHKKLRTVLCDDAFSHDNTGGIRSTSEIP